MDKTFKKPLAKKRTDFSMKSAIFDYKYIREHAMENPFGIKPDISAKPLVACTYAPCKAMYDPNKGLWLAGCTGQCVSD